MLLPHPDKHESKLRFIIPSDLLPLLAPLPWQTGLENWHEQRVKIISVKSGASRHVVRFVEVGKRSFAIKQTTMESAQREFQSYVTLRDSGIPTLRPIGIVERDDGTREVETRVGMQLETNHTGYLITELMEKVVPDSFLFKRAFSRKNRNRIWDAVIHLFVQLHGRGVYWGDASLANMLIKFTTEVVPELGTRTSLAAVLADAETVEIHPTISAPLRHADVEFFLESMLWTEADLKAGGGVTDPMVTLEDQHYVMTHYKERYAIEQEMLWFELQTQIDVDRLLGTFREKGQGALLLKHITEHKWYLSEKEGKEIPLVDAAKDWYKEVFQPVCRIFNQYGLIDFFPDRTASSLYVEVMERKYLMSEREKKDVGLAAALQDFSATHESHEPIHLTIGSVVRALTNLFARHGARAHPIPE